MTLLLIGFFAGGLFGFCLFAVVAAGKREDEQFQRRQTFPYHVNPVHGRWRA